MLTTNIESQKDQQIWREQFQRHLLKLDLNRMIAASKRQLTPALRKLLLDEKIRSAEQAAADDGALPFRPLDIDNDTV